MTSKTIKPKDGTLPKTVLIFENDESPFEEADTPIIQVNEIPTFETLVKNELQKFDSVVPAIEELKEQFLPLHINSIEDKKGYKTVAEGLSYIVSKRTAIEKKRKELKADSLEFGRRVDGRAKEITDMLSPIETHLKSEKEVIDNQLAEIELRKEAEKQMIISARHNILVQERMSLVGNEYQWNSRLQQAPIVLPAINLETLSNEMFTEYVNNVRNINVNEDEEIQEKQKQIAYKQAQADAKRIADQKAIDEAQAKLKEEQDKLRMEMEQIKTDRLVIRVAALEAIGVIKPSYSNYFSYNKFDFISQKELSDMAANEWSIIFEQIKDGVAKLKKQQEIDEKEAAEAKLKEQKEAEERAVKKVLEDQKRAEEKAENDRMEAEEKKKLEELAMGDKDKLYLYLTLLLAIPKPVMKTKKYKTIIEPLLEHIKLLNEQHKF